METWKEFRQIAGHTRSAVPSFLLGKGPEQERYTLIDAAIPDPELPGKEISIRLIPERQDRPPLTFKVDQFQSGMLLPETSTEAEREIAHEFVDAHWNLLGRRRQAIRAWGLTMIHERVPYEPGQALGFQDLQVLADHWTLPLHHDGRDLEVLEMSCVNPHCDCTEIYLQFFRKGGEKRSPEFVALLDMAFGNYQEADGGPLAPGWGKVVRALLDSLGDWREELSLRRDLLRLAARKRIRSKQQEIWFPFAAPEASPGPPGSRGPGAGKPSGPSKPQAPLAAERPAGRNDPCPCGSGKKFKKCCGK